MQPDLVITTQADIEVYQHINAVCYLLYRKKRSYIVTSISIILLGIYLGVTAYLDNDSFFLYVVTPIWMIIILGITYFLLRTSSVAKRATKRSIRRSNNPFLLIQYTFFPDHIAATSQTAGMQTTYSGVYKLVETSKFFLIFTTRLNAHCIKKSDLGPSNIDVFRGYMQGKTGKPFVQVKY